MDKLLSAALFYQQNFENRDFYLLAAKKRKEIEFYIRFNAMHFHHLAGLHKLTDVTQLQENVTLVYRNILNGKITYNDIKNSKYLSQMETRLDHFEELRAAFFSKELMIRSLGQGFNTINAEFILTKTQENREWYAHLFFKKNKNDIYVPVTFIIHPDNSFLLNNPNKWTVLSIEERKSERN